jgi:hypothetical protein
MTYHRCPCFQTFVVQSRRWRHLYNICLFLFQRHRSQYSRKLYFWWIPECCCIFMWVHMYMFPPLLWSYMVRNSGRYLSVVAHWALHITVVAIEAHVFQLWLALEAWDQGDSLTFYKWSHPRRILSVWITQAIHTPPSVLHRLLQRYIWNFSGGNARNSGNSRINKQILF